MEKPVYIEYLDCYVPETKLKLADCLDLQDNIRPYFSGREEFLKYANSVLCLDNVRVERRLDLEKMAMLVLDKYMQQKAPAAGTLRYVIIATDRSHAALDIGHQILRKFAIPRATVFRVADNYCANIDLAIGLAATLLRARQEPSRAIIISGTKVGDGLAGRVVGTYGILGDSAGITVLSNTHGPHLAEVREQVVITRGELAAKDLTKDNTLLHLQSFSVCLKELLLQSGLSPSMVDQVAVHNANDMLILQVIKSCKIDIRAVNSSNSGKFGHLGSCDLVLNLKTILEQGKRGAGNIVSLSLGIVGSYVSTLYKQ